MALTVWSGLGALTTLLLVVLVGIYAGRRVKNAGDFTGGSQMGVPMIAGSLVGTLVGGASTIGTAQLAFTYGFSAWWFTLGGGIGLFVLAFCFAGPMYRGGYRTLPQILSKSYGKGLATLAAVLMSVGTFISIISQLLSGQALITSVAPVGKLAAMGIVVLLMGVYVIFGGAWGAGMVGILKTLLMYLATLTCGVVSLRLAGGLPALTEALPRQQYWNLFARGVWKDGGAGASLLFGVLTTQAYLLPVLSAKSLKVSRAGAALGGGLTVLIGIAGIFVGMFMRLQEPDMDAAAALPVFVIRYLPDFLGGIILATLLIAIVGTGAGLALGISSMLSGDVYKSLLRPKASDKEQLWVSRAIIAAVLLTAAVFSLGEAGSLILGWSFLSMGLRGAVAFAPMCFGLFCKKPISRPFVAAAMAAGPLLVIAGNYFLPKHIDPLFLGMAGALLICALGWLAQRLRRNSYV